MSALCPSAPKGDEKPAQAPPYGGWPARSRFAPASSVLGGIDKVEGLREVGCAFRQFGLGRARSDHSGKLSEVFRAQSTPIGGTDLPVVVFGGVSPSLIIDARTEAVVWVHEARRHSSVRLPVDSLWRNLPQKGEYQKRHHQDRN
jgi:hypothetical protein